MRSAALRIALAVALADVLGVCAVRAEATSLSAGLRAGPLMGRTDYTDEVSGGAQVFARYRLQEGLELEALAGYGHLSGSDFATDLALLGLEVLYTVPIGVRWKPLVRSGVTGIRHDIAEYPAVRSGNAESIAWSAGLPLGLGLRALLNHRVALELTGTYTYTLRDDLDGRTDVQGNDWLFSAGVALVFGHFGEPPHRSRLAAAPLPDAAVAPPPAATPVAAMPPADRDEDGLTDREETARYFTNPLMADSDLDELTDGDEVQVYGTDPNRADTDGDDTPDGAEVAAGRDPLVADAPVEPAPVEDTPAQLPLEMKVISFGSGGSRLGAAARAILDEVAAYLRSHPEVELSLRGYSDSVGSQRANLHLSGRRSGVVRDYLVARGVDDGRLTLEAFGEADPIADNTTAAGRRANRRVELAPLP